MYCHCLSPEAYINHMWMKFVNEDSREQKAVSMNALECYAYSMHILEFLILFPSCCDNLDHPMHSETDNKNKLKEDFCNLVYGTISQCYRV